MALVALLFGGASAQEPAAPRMEWRAEVIGFEREMPVTLGAMVECLEALFLPELSARFDSSYGATLRGSEQVDRWIQGYLDFRALSRELKPEQLKSAQELMLNDAKEIITRRVEERIRAAKQKPDSAPFPPGVTAEAWASHELKRFLTNDGLALLNRILAERQIEQPIHADVLRHYEKHPLRWDGGIDASMMFFSFRDAARSFRYDRAARAEIEARAARVRKEIAEGAEFAELAPRYSEDASTAASGGRIGWLTYKESPLPEEATVALFDTAAGNLSAPVITRRGVFIFLVHERRPRPSPPFAQIELFVSEDLRRERARRLILDRRRQFQIDER